ncbi:MAG: hypothetical protein A3K10_10635 [Bacteroidetes bacterium RIFCSPLOWO2_12_FULL_31_6]|nr:MAG: hypothetical protein A3K10_10635 [Bacteroidetes bacterium RIFCSPLOWO2_12_FULL_31_6]
MKKIIIILLVSIGTLYARELFSQVSSPQEIQLNLAMAVEQEIPEAVLDTLTDSFYLLQQATELKLALNIILLDTNQISKINVKLGTTPGGMELMNHAFIYDQQNPGTGLSYERNAKNIKLGLGNYPNTTNALYYTEVEIEDAVGNKSSIITTDTSN